MMKDTSRIPLLIVLAAFILAGIAAESAWADSSWQQTITVSETGGTSGTVTFGVAPTATDGVDAALGEVERPPLPPSGNFDTRFTGTSLGNGVILDLRSGAAPPVEHTLTLSFQRATGGNITLSWDAAQVASVTMSAVIQDPFGGILVNADMRTQSQVVITNAAITSVLVKFTSVEGGGTPEPSPTVTGIAPTSGYVGGGTAVTITGSNFQSDATVTIGGVAATSVVVVSGTSITATTPAHAEGATEVVVTNPDDQSATLTGGYTYVGVAVTSIIPNSGFITGGTAVTITGSNFQSDATVTIGGVAATSVVVVSGTSITATTPAHAEGATGVVVTNPDGQSVTLVGGFTYVAIIEPSLSVVGATDASLNYSAVGVGNVQNGSAGEVTFKVRFTNNAGVTAAGQAINWVITNNGSETIYVFAGGSDPILPAAPRSVQVATDAEGISTIVLDAQGDTQAGTTSVSVTASTTAPNSEGVNRSLSRNFSATWNVPQTANSWQQTITVSETGGTSGTVTFGVAPTATDGVDAALGEVERPPLPPSGNFDTRFTGTGLGNGVILDLRSGAAPPVEHTLTLSFQRAAGGNITLSWDAAQVASATTSAVIQDPFGGILVNADMRTQSQVVITNAAITSVLVKFTSVEGGGTPTPTQLVITQTPTTANSGQPMTPALKVKAQDNEDTGFSGVAITVSLASGAGSLSGTLTQSTGSDGVATFADLIYSSTTGGDQNFTLMASATGLPSATSGTITFHPIVGISGVVQAGEVVLAGAVVQAWDEYPAGTVVATDTTDAQGVFALSLAEGTYDLRSFKAGYFPNRVEGVSVPASGVTISLMLTPTVQETNEFVFFWSDSTRFLNELVQPGDVVVAYDPQEVACGLSVVSVVGTYGAMSVYWDDPDTPGDEGAVSGDRLHFQLNAANARVVAGDPVWISGGDPRRVDLAAPADVEQAIPLVEGWNLVSWNVDAREDSIATRVAPCVDRLIRVIGFETPVLNPNPPGTGGKLYDPTLPSFINTLKVTNHRLGYWFKMSAPCTLAVVGEPIPVVEWSLSLTEGWNLISYLPTAIDSSQHAVGSVLDHLIRVIGFETSTLNPNPPGTGGKLYDPTLPSFINTMKRMVPRLGYWFKMSAPDTLRYPDTPVAVGGLAKRTVPSGSLAEEVYPTNEWMGIYGDVLLDGLPAPEETVIDAVDAQGHMAGRFAVHRPGVYGYLPIYRDDPETPVDEGAEMGEWLRLRVNQIPTDQQVQWTEFGDLVRVDLRVETVVSQGIPATYALYANYPNPFNPQTTIGYELPRGEDVVLRIYNLEGQVVRELVRGWQEAGSYRVGWDGRGEEGQGVASGVYLYQLRAGAFVQTCKLLLIK